MASKKAGRRFYAMRRKFPIKMEFSGDELLQVIGEFDALIVRGRTKVNSAVLSAGTKIEGRSGDPGWVDG